MLEDDADTYRSTTSSVEDTQRIAASLAPLLAPGDVCVLTGDIGAGKTQFVKGVASGLGITEPVTSPTFNILIQYISAQAGPLNHFDWYRLEDSSELVDVGYYDVLEQGIIFVEWGEKFPEALPDDYLIISLLAETDDVRSLLIRSKGKRLREIAKLWSKDIGAEKIAGCES